MIADARCFWTTVRLNRALVAIGIGLLIACVIGWQRDTESTGLLKSGDFPAFYAPAVIIAEGNGTSVFDEALQTDVENRFWPSLNGTELVAAYPAFFAVLCSPLAALPPLAAKLCFAALGFFGLVFFSHVALRNRIENLSLPTIVAMMFFFPPLFIAVVGGQNTGITLGLIAIVYWSLQHKTANSKWIPGCALAALLYKPQFGIPLLVPFLLWREWRVLGVWLICAILLYAAAVPFAGSRWPIAWFDALQLFAPREFAVNGVRMISLIGGAAAWWPKNLAAMYVAIALSTALYFIALYRLVKAPRQRAEAFIEFVAIVAVLSPKGLFYELGLVAPALFFNSSLQESANCHNKFMERYLAVSALCAGAFIALNYCAFPFFSVFGIGSLALIRAGRKIQN